MKRIARAGALIALALLTALALAGPATAKKKPRKHDGKGAEAAKVLPKGWAKHNKVKGGAKGDPDDDGLTNWGEFRSRTKPHKLDSDKDGLGDALEDFDRDGLDNGSEEAAGTDPGRKDSDGDGVLDGDEDADRDGLSNAAEDRTGHDPREADSDGDGIKDGDENAGVVAAYDAPSGSVTITLAAGGTLSGTVDRDTLVLCGVEEDYEAGEDWSEDEDELDVVGATLAEEGDEYADDDEQWEDDEATDCAAELAPGVVVHEAEIEDGVFWTLDLVV